jgi:hypothetical protein
MLTNGVRCVLKELAAIFVQRLPETGAADARLLDEASRSAGNMAHLASPAVRIERRWSCFGSVPDGAMEEATGRILALVDPEE